MPLLVNFKFSHIKSSSIDKFKVEANITSNSNSNSNFNSKSIEFELGSIAEIQSTYNWWKSNYYNLVNPQQQRKLVLKGFNEEKNTNISVEEIENNIACFREECDKSVFMLR
ncbi:MAG: hypothetical protein AAF757_06545 [Cyanobacteria bacterium P01_D01_bin.116]